MKTIKQLEKEIKSLRKNEDNYKECPKCNIHFGKQLTWRKLEVLQTLKDVLNLLFLRSSESFLENKDLIELQLKLLKDIEGKGLGYAIVSLRALIRIHIDKYKKEIENKIKGKKEK